MQKLFKIILILSIGILVHGNGLALTQIYSEDFENGAGGWTTNNSGSDGWALGTPSTATLNTAASGSNAWVTNLNGNYSNNASYYLTSPIFNFASLTNDPIIKLNFNKLTENCCDGTILQYSIDGGNNWIKVGTTNSGLENWYNNSNGLWSGASGGWVSASHKLVGLAGEASVILRFVFNSDANVVDEGMAIDDVEIYDYNVLIDGALSKLTVPTIGSLTNNENIDVEVIAHTSSATIVNIIVDYTITGPIPDTNRQVEFNGVNLVGGDTILLSESGFDFSSPGQYFISATISIVDDFLNNNTLSTNTIHTIMITNYPYVEDFELDSGYWLPNNSDNAGWEYGTPATANINSAASGLNAWATNLDGNYDNNASHYLTSPIFDFSVLVNDPLIKLQYNTITASCCDGTLLQYSLDGGVSWDVFGWSGSGLENWYNDTEELWSGSSGGWVSASHELTGLAGQSSVILRFYFKSNGDTNNEGMAIDDIEIVDTFTEGYISNVILTRMGTLTNNENIDVEVTALPNSNMIADINVEYTITGPIPFTTNQSFPAVDLTGGNTITLPKSGFDFSTLGEYTVTTKITIVGDFALSNNMQTNTVTNLITLNNFPYVEDFESGTGGWVTNNSNIDGWELGTPITTNLNTVPSGINAWVTNLDANYSDVSYHYLTSPVFDFSALTSDPVIRFQHNIITQSCCDGALLQYSINGGDDWTTLGSVGSGLENWYNDPNIGWSGDSGGWVNASHMLTGLAGESSVILQFYFNSDDDVTDEGMAIDDVQIYDVITEASISNITTPGIGVLTNNESIDIEVTAIAGSATITNITVNYTITGPTPITIPPVSYPVNLTGGNSIILSKTGFDFSLQGQYIVTATISIADDFLLDNNTKSTTAIHTTMVTSYPYVEDFESGTGSWMTDNADNAGWELGTPATTNLNGAASGSNAWVTNLDGNYNNSVSHYLISPVFNFSSLTNDPVIELKYNSITESCCDGTLLQYSINGGSDWITLGSSGSGLENWYSVSNETWSGSSGGWLTARHNLTGLAGQSKVILRFYFNSDGGTSDEGMAIDDIEIITAFADLSVLNIVDFADNCALTNNETVTVQITNLGTLTSTGKQISLTINDVPTSPQSLPDILAGGTLYYSFYGIDLSVSKSYKLEVNVDIADEATIANNYSSKSIDASIYTITANASKKIICAGEQVILTGAGGTSYIWDKGVIDGVAFLPLSTSTYNLASGSGCSNTANVAITVNPLPNVSGVATPPIVCAGEQVTLTGGGAVSYTWDNGVTDGIAFAPSSTTTYTVTGADANGCQTIDQVKVIVNPLPAVSATSTATKVCAGEQITLTGGGAVSYVWDNGVTDGVPFAPAATNTYTVTGTDANSCQATSEIPVTVNPVTTILANSTAKTICRGEKITLTGSGDASSYTWDNGVIDGVAFAPSATTTYNVTDATKCSNTSEITITVNPVPIVFANATANAICAGKQVTLIGGGADSYVWDNGVSDGIAFTPSTTNTYTVIGTDINNCEATATIIVNVTPLTTVVANTTATTICYGEEITLTGSGATSYTWDNGVTNGVAFMPTSTTTYSVIANFECSKTAQVTITVNPLPEVSATSTSTAVCAEEQITLTGEGAESYLWDNGVANGVAFIPSNTNTYTVTGTTANNCKATDEITVTMSPLTAVVANTTATTICLGAEITLTGSGEASSYAWDNGVTDGVAFAPTATTTYSVTDAIGCSNTAQITITVNPPPVISASSTAPTVCDGEQITLTGSGGSSYFWDNGVTDGTAFIPTATTTYTVTGTDANGCSATDQITITVKPSPTVAANTTANTLCSGEQVTLTATSSVASFSWDNSVTDGVAFTPSATTTYTVTGTSANGCNDSAEVTITVNNIPIKPTISLNENNVLTSSSTVGNQWFLDGTSINEANQQTYIASAGTKGYTVQVTIDGCTSPMSEPFIITSTDENQLNDGVKVWPNPVTSKISLQLPYKSLISGYVIYNTTGAIVKSDKFIEPDYIQNIDVIVNDFESGVYMMKVISDSEIFQVKFIKN
jgi:hypothetical protein